MTQVVAVLAHRAHQPADTRGAVPAALLQHNLQLDVDHRVGVGEKHQHAPRGGVGGVLSEDPPAWAVWTHVGRQEHGRVWSHRLLVRAS